MPPAFVKTPEQEKKWQRAKKAVMRARNKTEDQFNDQDWGLVTKIMKNIKKSHRDEMKEWIKKSVGVATAGELPYWKQPLNTAAKRIKPAKGTYVKGEGYVNEKKKDKSNQNLAARAKQFFMKAKDTLEGGLADNESDSKFNKKELKRGTKVEKEHTKKKKVAKEIAKDHLKEHGDYYKALDKMEKRLKERKKRS